MATQPKETAAAEPAEAAEAEPSPPTPGGFKAWLPLLITVIAMPLLAYSMTSFVLLPKLQKGLGITPVNAKEPGGKKGAGGAAKKESYTMNKLLVNVAGTMGGRYLLVSISLTGTDTEFKTKIE